MGRAQSKKQQLHYPRGGASVERERRGDPGSRASLPRLDLPRLLWWEAAAVRAVLQSRCLPGSVCWAVPAKDGGWGVEARWAAELHAGRTTICIL